MKEAYLTALGLMDKCFDRFSSHARSSAIVEKGRLKCFSALISIALVFVPKFYILWCQVCYFSYKNSSLPAVCPCCTACRFVTCFFQTTGFKPRHCSLFFTAAIQWVSPLNWLALTCMLLLYWSLKNLLSSSCPHFWVDALGESEL